LRDWLFVFLLVLTPTNDKCSHEAYDGGATDDGSRCVRTHKAQEAGTGKRGQCDDDSAYLSAPILFRFGVQSSASDLVAEALLFLS